MKKIINTYDPVIYPRKLWVANYVEGLDRKFTFLDVKDFTKVSDVDTYTNIIDDYNTGFADAVTIPVNYKSTGEEGVLVIIFNTKTGDLINTIAHEATHVTDYMYDALGLSADAFARNECYAYLLGWAAGSISSSVIKFEEEND
jgi:hypothetical protein